MNARLVTLSASLLGLLLAGCGGGGGPAAAAAGPTGPVVLSGTAATGAPLERAVVKVLDARGVEVGRSEPVASDGRYSATLDEGAVAPFVLVAELDGQTAHVSVFDRAETAVVNVTQLTSLISARLSSTGTPGGLQRDFEAGQVPSPSAIAAKVSEVVAAIAPVAQALGDTTNPLTGSFSVGGAGHDQLLDALDVAIHPATSTSANVEVTVRTKRAEDQPMPSVTFGSDASSVPTLPAVQRAELGADGTSARVASLIELLNQCYGSPLADRTDSTVSPAVLRPGPCREAFWQGDPGHYLHNGWRVGAGRAFNGMFTDSGNGGLWSRPVIEYVRDNDDVVFSAQWELPDGSQGSEVLVARQTAAGALQLIGNQYAYPMSVRPIVWDSQHLLWPQADYRSTGYNINIESLVDGDGQALFDRVVVTSPPRFSGSIRRGVFTLRPVPGAPYLRHQRDGGAMTGSGIVQFNAYFNAERTAEPLHPSELNVDNFLWGDPREWTDGALEAIPNKGVWTFEYYLAGNTGSVPDAVQSMTTSSRAPSLRESRMMQFAALTQPTLDRLTEGSREWGSYDVAALQAAAPDPATAELSLDWTVPPDVFTAPTRTNIYGRSGYGTWSTRPYFGTGTSFRTSARTAQIVCPVSVLGGIHCTSDQPPRWVANSRITTFELWGRNPKQVEALKAYKTYKPDTRL